MRIYHTHFSVEPLRTFQHPEHKSVFSIHVSHTWNLLAGHKNGDISVWELRHGGQLHLWNAHGNCVRNMAEGNNVLVSASDDRSVKIHRCEDDEDDDDEDDDGDDCAKYYDTDKLIVASIMFYKNVNVRDYNNNDKVFNIFSRHIEYTIILNIP